MQLNDLLTIEKEKCILNEAHYVTHYANDGYIVEVHEVSDKVYLNIYSKLYYPSLYDSKIEVLGTSTLKPHELIMHMNRLKLAHSTYNQIKQKFPFTEIKCSS